MPSCLQHFKVFCHKVFINIKYSKLHQLQESVHGTTRGSYVKPYLTASPSMMQFQ